MIKNQKEEFTAQDLKDVLSAFSQLFSLIFDFSFTALVTIFCTPLWLGHRVYRLMSSLIAEYYSVSSFISRALAICAIAIIFANWALIYKLNILTTSVSLLTVNWLIVSASLMLAGHLLLTNNYKEATFFGIFSVVAIFKLSATLVVFFYLIIRFYYTMLLAAKFSIRYDQKNDINSSDDKSNSVDSKTNYK